MEKRRASPLRIFLLCAVAALPACAEEEMPNLTHEQQSELSAFVGAYHLCVAQTARVIDDGRSPVVTVARIAMARCKAEAADVSRYLDRIKLSETVKARYIDDLLQTAARQSAVMLRRRRGSDWESLQA